MITVRSAALSALTLSALTLLVAGCAIGPSAVPPLGDPGQHGSSGTHSPRSGSVAPGSPAGSDPSVRVSTVHPVTVLDDGSGPRLCLAGVATSMPPQCGGPVISGWNWAEHPGYEQEGGTRWGEYTVVGTWDGTSLSYERTLPARGRPAPIEPEPDFSTPCRTPDGGWQVLEPERTTQQTLDETFTVAQGLPGYSRLWLDQSPNPQDGTQPTSLAEELTMNDPRQLILNVRVTDDVAGAERSLRRTWGGMLCVSQARYTGEQLSEIAAEVGSQRDILTAATGDDRVDVAVTYDDGSLQTWADQTYGDGVVVVHSLLVEKDN